jgi:hypothetical protein
VSICYTYNTLIYLSSIKSSSVRVSFKELMVLLYAFIFILKLLLLFFLSQLDK